VPLVDKSIKIMDLIRTCVYRRRYL